MKLKLKFFLLQSTKTMRLSNPRNRSQWNIVKFNKEGSVFFFFFLIPLLMMQSGVLRKLQLASTFISLTRIMIEWILQSNLWYSSQCLGPINVYIKETDRLWTRGQYPGTWTTLQNKWKKGFAKIPWANSIVQCSEWHREGCTIITFFFEILWP